MNFRPDAPITPVLLDIPKVVRESMAGAEIYAHPQFAKNPPDVRARAVEDARFLVAVNFDGYEDTTPAQRRAVNVFAETAKP